MYIRASFFIGGTDPLKEFVNARRNAAGLHSGKEALDAHAADDLVDFSFRAFVHAEDVLLQAQCFRLVGPVEVANERDALEFANFFDPCSVPHTSTPCGTDPAGDDHHQKNSAVETKADRRHHPMPQLDALIDFGDWVF